MTIWAQPWVGTENAAPLLAEASFIRGDQKMRITGLHLLHYIWFTLTAVLLVGFQNCSPVAVTDAAGSSNLVQGPNSALGAGTTGAGIGGSPGSGGISGGTQGGTTGGTMSGGTSSGGTTTGSGGTTVTTTTSGGTGVCVLTCKHHDDDEDDNDMDHDGKLSNSESAKVASSGIHGQCQGSDDQNQGDQCGDEDDSDTGHNEQVVQHRDSDHDKPKTACMTKPACQTLDQALSQGRFKIINAATARVSVRNHAVFRERRDDDCGSGMTDDDVQKAIEANDSH